MRVQLKNKYSIFADSLKAAKADKETELYVFDKYLFANWDTRESVMKSDDEDS